MAKAAAAATVIAAVACALTVAPASALTLLPLGKIPGPGPGSSFSQLMSESVAVNDLNGHILVADSGSGLVYDFASAADTSPATWDGSGTPAGSFGGGRLSVAVDDATGDVYVADTTHAVIDKLDAAGNLITSFGDSTPSPNGQLAGLATPAGSFSPATSGSLGIAVDQATHDLYVIDASHQVVDVFNSTGGYVSQINDPAAVAAGLYGCAGAYADGIAVNPASGHVFVSDSCSVQTFEFDAAGRFVKAWTGSGTPAGGFGGYTSVGVDAATGDVLINDTSDQVVDVFDSAGGYLQQIVGAPSGSAGGVTVDPTTGDVYVSGNQDGSVEIFGPPPPPTPPSVDDQSVTDVASTSATLEAQINPDHGDTTYHFEYGIAGPCTSNPCTSAPIPDADLGGGASDQRASEPVTGLTAGTVYHYQVVATNAAGTTDGPDRMFSTLAPPGSAGACPNAALRTGPSASLPDCRAWEQVSPVDKGGVDAIYLTQSDYPQRAAPNGSAFAYQTATSFGNASGNVLPNAYLATRTPDGWTTDSASPPTPDPGPSGGMAAAYDFSPDLSEEMIGVPDEALAPNTPPNVENLFLRYADGSYSLITTAPPVVGGGCPPGNSFGIACFETRDEATFAGASSDFSQVIFEANDCLTPDAPCAPLSGGFEPVNNLYEQVGGRVTLVGYLPDGTPVAAQPGSGEPANYFGATATAQDVAGAISADGSRIFLDATADGGSPDPAQSGLSEIYERVDGSRTVEVSAPSPGATPANATPEPATYWGASSDGSQVLFTSSAELTSDANTGAANASQDLYQYDTGSGALKDLSVDTNPTDVATGAGVAGVVGLSTDGSYVYFVATGQLVPGRGADGQPNLYLSHAGQVSFLATLAPGDSNDWTNRRTQVQAYVTPDGGHVAFMSTAGLTAYDNSDRSTRQPDSEVYEYSAPSAQLVCASCDPTGARPTGNAFIGMADNVFELGKSAFYQPRVLSDDGRRLFFSSPDALTPGASGPHAKLYEYQDGGVALIDAATRGDDLFLDASSSGDDVFLATRDQLVASDQDQLADIYDARVNGGFPAPPTPPSCQADACQAQTSAPSLPVAGTIAFIGPGNAQPGPASAAVRVLSTAVRGPSFVLRVMVPAPGWITLTGDGIKTVHRSMANAGTYRLRVRLTARERRLLQRRHKLRLRLQIRSAAATGTPGSATVGLTVKL